MSLDSIKQDLENLKAKVEAEFAGLVSRVESVFGRNNSVTGYIDEAKANALTHIDNHTNSIIAANAGVADMPVASTAVGATSTAALTTPDVEKVPPPVEAKQPDQVNEGDAAAAAALGADAAAQLDKFAEEQTDKKA